MDNNRLQKDLICLKNNMKKKFVSKLIHTVNLNRFEKQNESDSDIEEILIIDDTTNFVEEVHLDFDFNKKYKENFNYDYEKDYKDELNDAFDDTSRKNQLIVIEAKLDLLLESLNPIKYLIE